MSNTDAETARNSSRLLGCGILSKPATPFSGPRPVASRPCGQTAYSSPTPSPSFAPQALCTARPPQSLWLLPLQRQPCGRPADLVLGADSLGHSTPVGRVRVGRPLPGHVFRGCAVQTQIEIEEAGRCRNSQAFRLVWGAFTRALSQLSWVSF